jgi:hypothetical protein
MSFRDPGMQRAHVAAMTKRKLAYELGVKEDELPDLFDCEWCGKEFDPKPNLSKQWVCPDCMAPRHEAARLLRSLPYNGTIRRAAHIVDSPNVEQYLITQLAVGDIERMCLARNDRK